MRGSTLFLPVQVPGARFSTGDVHGCQGDGEVCVTGLECPMYATLRFGLEKGRRIPGPQFSTAGALTPRVDHAGFYGTTGIGPDLYAGAQAACVRPEDLRAPRRDAGEYVVSAVLPEAIFR